MERFGGPEAFAEAWITELFCTALRRKTGADACQLALF